jgi:hypothetical protein
LRPLTDEAWEELPEVRRYRRYLRESGGRLLDVENPADPCPFEGFRPPHFPVIRWLTTDEKGRFWIEWMGQDGMRLSVLAPDGTLVGDEEMPPRDPSVPFYVRGNRLYTVSQGPLGVQSVEVYELDLP